jgi:hypothetical protein
MSANPNRIDPADLEEHPVYMGTSQTDPATHAKERLDRQLRLLAIIYLLRIKGTLKKGVKVSLGETTLQHGRGGTGEQAAHKLLLTAIIDGLALYQIVKDTALQMFLIYLSSETSVIDRVYNEADAVIENGGGRAQMVVIIQDVLDKDYSDTSYGAYKTVMLEIWKRFCLMYQTAASKAIHELGTESDREKSNYEARLKLQAANPKFPQKQIDEALRRWKAFGAQKEVVEFYLKIASGLTFPLSEGELENMYEIVMT